MIDAAERLERRPLGATGLQVTPIGLAALPVSAWRPGAPRLRPEEVERAFHDFGINTFLAHPLMRDLFEGVRRLVRAGHRDEMVIISESSFPFGFATRRELEWHLRLLGTDHLDGWLAGWVRGRWDLRPAVWGEFERLRGAGKARALGFSSHNRKLAATLAQELPVDLVMIRYNAAHRGAEREVFEPLEALGERRPGIISYTATRWGMLLRPLPDFPTAMSGPECYRFVLGHPLVDATWCAPGTLDELKQDVLGILEGPLEPERLGEVRRFGDAVHAAAKGGYRWMFRE